MKKEDKFFCWFYPIIICVLFALVGWLTSLTPLETKQEYWILFTVAIGLLFQAGRKIAKLHVENETKKRGEL